MEIERKFLVGGVSEIGVDLSYCTKKRYEQAYISTNPTIRVRNEDGAYVLCVKSADTADSGISREEFELALTREQFDSLWKKTEATPVVKDRYFVPLKAPHEGLTAEIDVYHGGLSGLVIIEVEFADEKTAREFVPPSWFGKDITDVSSDRRYKNSSLSVFGKPGK